MFPKNRELRTDFAVPIEFIKIVEALSDFICLGMAFFIT
jgi:hypothetical protein